MNNEKYQQLYMDLKRIRKNLNELDTYNDYVKDELKNNFKINNAIIEHEKVTNFFTEIKEIKEKLSNEIIPDVYSNF